MFPVRVSVHVRSGEPSGLSSVHESEMGWSDGICALTPPPLHLSSLSITHSYCRSLSYFPTLFLS